MCYLLSCRGCIDDGEILSAMAALAPAVNLLFPRCVQFLERAHRRLDINSKVHWIWSKTRVSDLLRLICRGCIDDGGILSAMAALAPAVNLLFPGCVQFLERAHKRLDINSKVH